MITGILNIWQHDPADVAAAHARITADHPNRFLLGIGIGHPEATSDYTRPLTAMREFFDGLDAAETPVPQDERLAAALGPKMLDLAKERSLGTHPYFITLEHTHSRASAWGRTRWSRPRSRSCVGPEPGVGPPDRARVRQALPRAVELHEQPARVRLHARTTSPTAARTSLIDAVIPHGSPERVAAYIEAHLDAGADHVCIQPLGSDEPTRDYAALAAVLL